MLIATCGDKSCAIWRNMATVDLVLFLLTGMRQPEWSREAHFDAVCLGAVP